VNGAKNKVNVLGNKHLGSHFQEESCPEHVHVFPWIHHRHLRSAKTYTLEYKTDPNLNIFTSITSGDKIKQSDWFKQK
jgi:hypothetical protein